MRKFWISALSSSAAVAVWAAPAVDICSRLEVLWDDCLVDTNLTTAVRRIHQPEYVGEGLVFDRPWEGDGCGYHVIVPDRDAKGDFLRLYYRGWSIGMATPENTAIPKSEPCICYAESHDGGRTWTRPNLGLHAFNGSTENNIMLGPKEFGFVWDNIFFFKDANPACPADERYKAIAGRLEKDEDFGLWCFLSADGIHWRKGWLVTKDGEFDSHNVAFWDPVTRRYHCYYRNHHFIEPHDRHDNVHARDVRHMTSSDFRTWSKSERLSYGAGVTDYALYTNCVMPYPRAPHLYVGFPTRYVMRKKEWTDTYDKLPGVENRRFRSKKDIRYGIAITDCAFMVTRDGVNFCREEDAFMDPGPENAFNWVYGDAYPYYGLLTAPGRRPGSDRELMILCSDGYWSGRPQTMLRYALRMDGFVSRHAPDAGARLVTKPFVFDGTALQINFRTSAYGQVFVTLRTADGAKAIHSHEIFGNKIDRVVGFMDGRVADFAGRPVVLEFDMHDADIYAFQFVRQP